MTAQEALAARRLEWKDWFVQAMAFGYAQTDALRRAAAAKGMGLDLAQFSRPFPGSPMTQTITDNSVNAAPPPAAVPATGPSAQAGTLSGPAPGPAPERLPHGPAAKPSNPLAIMALTGPRCWAVRPWALASSAYCAQRSSLLRSFSSRRHHQHRLRSQNPSLVLHSMTETGKSRSSPERSPLVRSLCLALLCLGSTALFAPAQCPCQPCRPQACQAQDCDCFEEAYDQAVRDNKPLLIFVQQKARGIEGCLSCSVACYPGQRGAGVIIGLPDGKGNLLEVARRDSYPTEA